MFTWSLGTLHKIHGSSRSKDPNIEYLPRTITAIPNTDTVHAPEMYCMCVYIHMRDIYIYIHSHTCIYIQNSMCTHFSTLTGPLFECSDRQEQRSFSDPCVSKDAGKFKVQGWKGARAGKKPSKGSPRRMEIEFL